MATVEEIVAIARSIEERANDLRALEVLGSGPGHLGMGAPITGDYVEAWQDTGPERWDRWREEYDLGGSGIDSSRFGIEFDYIPGLFEKLAFGDRSDYDDVLSQLMGTAGLLADGESDSDHLSFTVNNIQGLNEGWSGSFPNAFRTRFANRLQYLAPMQTKLIYQLATAVKGHWNTVEGARESLLSIAKDTEDALTNAIRGGFDGSYMYDSSLDTKKTWDSCLAILGTFLAIAGAAAAIPTGGIAIASFAVAQITGVSSLVTTFVGGIEVADAVETTATAIGGTTVDEILASMHDELTKLSVEINEEERSAADGLQQTIDDVDAALALTDPDDPDAFQLEPYRPAIADEVPVPGSDQMGHS